MNNSSQHISDNNTSIIYPDNFEFPGDEISNNDANNINNDNIIQPQQHEDEFIHRKKSKKFPLIELTEAPTNKKESHKKLNNDNPFAGNISHLLFGKKENELKSALDRTKTKQMEFIHSQYTFNCVLQCLFSILSIFSGIVEYEHTVISTPDNSQEYIHTHKDISNVDIIYNINKTYFDNCQIAAYVSSYFTLFNSICLWITIFFDNILNTQLMNSEIKKDCSKFTEEPENIIFFIIKLIIFIPCPNPITFGIDVHFNNKNYDVEYFVPLNAIFTAILLFRLWFLIKLFLVSSQNYTQRAFRLCKMNNVNLNLSFPFKAFMSANPFAIDTLLFIITLIVCSYNIRIFERYLDIYRESNFGNIYDSLWSVFITMSTVGYGDITPTTEFGRLFAMMSCVSGVFLVSLIVVSISNYLNIQGIELNVLNVIDRANIMDKKNKKGEKVVKEMLVAKKKFANRKNVHNNEKEDIKELEKHKDKMEKQLKKFKAEKEKLEKAYPSFNSYDEISQYLKFLEDNAERTDEKIEHILTVLDQLNGIFKANNSSEDICSSNHSNKI